MSAWKKIRIDGVEVEFPTEVVDEVEEILEKARRKKKEEEKEEEVEGKGDAKLQQLMERIQRRLRRLSEAAEEPSVTVLRKERERKLSPLEERRKALKEREEKYGYKAGRNAHLTKPKEYADVPESQFADPVGYNYPVNTPKRARAALAYFMRFHDQYDDVNAKLFIYERILRALKKFGIKRHFNPDFPGDWLMPRDLKEWMEGYDKYEEQDTEEMREKMLRRWSRKERRRLLKQDAGTFAVVPTLGAQAIRSEDIPSFAREMMETLGRQFEEIVSKVFSKRLEEFFEAFVEELKDFSKNIIETFDTLVEAIRESGERMAEATEAAAQEIRGALGMEEAEMPAAEEAPTPEEGKVSPEGEVSPEVPPEGEGLTPPVGPEGEEVTSPEKEEEERPVRVEALFKELLTHDLVDEWSKWLTSPSEDEGGEEEGGIVVDLVKGDFVWDEEKVETHVRFQDPRTGKVTRTLEPDVEEGEE